MTCKISSIVSIQLYQWRSYCPPPYLAGCSSSQCSSSASAAFAHTAIEEHRGLGTTPLWRKRRERYQRLEICGARRSTGKTYTSCVMVSLYVRALHIMHCIFVPPLCACVCMHLCKLCKHCGHVLHVYCVHCVYCVYCVYCEVLCVMHALFLCCVRVAWVCVSVFDCGLSVCYMGHVVR